MKTKPLTIEDVHKAVYKLLLESNRFIPMSPVSCPMDTKSYIVATSFHTVVSKPIINPILL